MVVSPDGGPLLAVDRQGAGVGERVMLTSDGRAIREIFGVEDSPIRWAVLGIVDQVRVKNKERRIGSMAPNTYLGRYTAE